MDAGRFPDLTQHGITAGIDDHGFHTGIQRLPDELGLLIKRIESGAHPAGFQNGEKTDHEFRQVGQEQSHPLTGFYTRFNQVSGHRIGQTLELLIGDLPIFQAQADPLGKFPGCIRQQLREYHIRVLKTGRHLPRVIFQPGALIHRTAPSGSIQLLPQKSGHPT